MTATKIKYREWIKKRYGSIHQEETEEKYATRRLDKAIWPKSEYNVEEYIDCHLPRPLSLNIGICKELFKKLRID